MSRNMTGSNVERLILHGDDNKNKKKKAPNGAFINWDFLVDVIS